MTNFKITKSQNNNYVLSLREAYGTKAISEIATDEELKEAREWVKKFYEGECKSQALEDLKKDKVLKYKNGAVVHAPADDTDYWYLDADNEVETDYWADTRSDEGRLANKNCFLAEAEAEEYAKRTKIYNALERQITIINHENNWVEDWSNGKEWKYYMMYHTTDNEYTWGWCTYARKGRHYMCVQAVEWLMSNFVTDEQRKIWIDGI